MKEKIDIIITDDHALFRKGISALLADFGFIGSIKEAANGKDLLKLLEREETVPEIVLLDIRMPEMDGVETQKKLKELYPQIKVVMLTMEDDEQFILYLINEGVNGYLLKNADPDEMENVIRKVMLHGFCFSDEISKLIINNLVHSKNREFKLEIEFTDRELEVLQLICKEKNGPEIADALNLSVRTIEGYRQKLLEKTKTKNMAGLVIYAIKNRLVTI